MRISDWSSDVCSSDLGGRHGGKAAALGRDRGERNGAASVQKVAVAADIPFHAVRLSAVLEDEIDPVAPRVVVIAFRRVHDLELRVVDRMRGMAQREFGRAHVLTPATNAHLVIRLLLDEQYTDTISDLIPTS